MIWFWNEKDGDCILNKEDEKVDSLEIKMGIDCKKKKLSMRITSLNDEFEVVYS